MSDSLREPDLGALLSFRGLYKTFVGTKALDGIDFDILPGEVHGLVGQNGSGKSTLIKLLAGIYAADEGSVGYYDGEPLDLSTTSGRHLGGVHVVHQDPGIITEMSTVENRILARRDRSLADRLRVDWKREAAAARKMLSRFDTRLDVMRPLSEASPVDRAIVAIAIAASGFAEETAPLLVLDEPTAILPRHEVERLLEIVRQLKAQSVSVLYVTHRLNEIFQICDRVTVLRDGRLIATENVACLTQHGLAELMVGDKVRGELSAGDPPPPDAPSVLIIESLSTPAITDLDLTVKRGEIVGIAGFPGSGADDLLRVLSPGHTGKVSGRAKVGPAGEWMPAARLTNARLPLVPGDRAREGIVPQFVVSENLTLSILGRLGRFWTSARREDGVILEWSKKLSIKAASSDVAITTLSGGNQQKVILAQCLAGDPAILLLSEPTAGVDIGTRQAIYEMLHELADEGLALLVWSTDQGDLLSLCHRIVVINEGRIVAELEKDGVTESKLLVSMEIKPLAEEVAA